MVLAMAVGAVQSVACARFVDWAAHIACKGCPGSVGPEEEDVSGPGQRGQQAWHGAQLGAAVPCYGGI